MTFRADVRNWPFSCTLTIACGIRTYSVSLDLSTASVFLRLHFSLTIRSVRGSKEIELIGVYGKLKLITRMVTSLIKK